MFELVIAVVIVLVIVGAAEHAGGKKIIDDELSRKIPHSATALAYVALAFSIDPKLIALGATAHLAVALVAYRFNLFSNARWVSRKTYGEFLFPLGVLATSLIAQNKWIFAAAVLNLGLADTMAALVGRKIGKRSYKIAGQPKSLEGFIAFALTSAVITGWVVFIAHAGVMHTWPIIVWLPILTAGIEAFTPYGLDNFLVPVFVAAILYLF